MATATIWHGGVMPDPAALTRFGDSGMPAHIGIEFTEAGPDFLRARMPVDHRTHQPFGRLHGGASVALAETVGSVAAAHTLDPERFAAVGKEINANHVRPVRDGWVYGTARAENIGRTTQIWSIRIEDETAKLVCISRLTVAVIEVARK